MLKPVGVDPLAEVVYRHLVVSRPSTIDEIAAGTGLTQEKVTGILRDLETTGLVSRAPGQTSRFGATDPSVTLSALVERTEADLERVRLGLDELIARFHSAHASADPAELVEVVTGQEAIIRRGQLMRRGARFSIRGLDKPPYAGDPTAHNEVEDEQVSLGVSAQVIYEPSAIAIPGRRQVLEQDIAHGEEARVLDNLPTKLVLVDDRVAMVPLRTADDVIDSCVIVHPSALLDALSGLFSVLWRLALPLGIVRTDDSIADGLGDEEQRVLGLMAAGLPDEAIGRQLGMSLRTVRRRVRGLMERYQMSSRFQLGLNAGIRGWVPPAAHVRQRGVSCGTE